MQKSEPVTPHSCHYAVFHETWQKHPQKASGYGFCVTEENKLVNVHTLLTVSLTAGTGNRGKDVWKLYNMGLRPEKSFTRA